MKKQKKKKNELTQDIIGKERKLTKLPSGSDQRQQLLAEIEKIKKELVTTNLAEIIGSCQRKVVHVDNPPINITVADNEDEDEKQEREELVIENKNKRGNSRKILLEHLSKSCPKSPYKPPKLQTLSEAIVKYMEEKFAKRKELEEKKKNLGLDIKEVKANDSQNFTKADVTGEKKKQAGNRQSFIENSGIGSKKIIRLKIIGLESETKELKSIKKLKKEIQERDERIREIVRGHILNDRDEISNIQGGEVFIDIIAGSNSYLSFPKQKNIDELLKECQKLEKECQGLGGETQSIDQIEIEIKQNEQELFELKKQLLNTKEIVEEWQKQGFNVQQAQRWIDVLGNRFDPEYDVLFCAWLKNIKKLGLEWATNYKEDYQILSERFKKYGLCLECNQPNTGEQWCQDCNSKRLKQGFSNWTSNNPQIDKFIQRYQLAATDADKFLEWIPYEQFRDVEYLAQGGFGKVYKARWNNKEVVLKILNNSPENTDFLQEIEKHKIIDDWFNNIVPCYGISQDPKGNYLMVMKYMPEGNLRHYLSNKNKGLSLQDKFRQLLHIAQGLKDIHQKNLVHRDFHSGNILKGVEKTTCLITDLGLCKPTDEQNKEDKVYGVLPYVAPEVLRGQTYTQAADIYSFGIVAYELLSGLPPYYDLAHNNELAVKICQGLRPKFQIRIPQLLEDLINWCLNHEPQKRPTANETERILRSWEKDWKFASQLQEAEKYNQNLPEEIKYPNITKKIHSGAVYTSRLLPTQEISRLLTQQILQGVDNQSQIINLAELNIASELETQELEQIPQIIHKPT